MTDQNKLVTIVKESGLTESSKVEELMKSFTSYFTDAKELSKGAKDIIVTNESQTDLMVQAREKRLELKKVRVEVEKVRKQLKEQSVREGRAIDGIANVIKALIVPVEQHLEKQEKYIEVKEELRLEKQYTERVERLSKYIDDMSMYNVKDMSDEAFETLITNYKKAAVDRLKAEKQTEKKRVKQEKAEKLFNKRQIEIALYSDFLKGFLLEFDTPEKYYQEQLEIGKKAKKSHDDKQEAIRKKNEELNKRLKKARKLKEAFLRKELTDKRMAEAKELAEAEAKQKALLAPDKEKLNKLASELDNFPLPAVQSNKANQVLKMTALKIKETANFLKENAKSL